MTKCNEHDVFMSDITGKLDLIESKLDAALFLSKDVDNLKENLAKHENNTLIHFSKWWIIAGVIGSVVATAFGLGGCIL